MDTAWFARSADTKAYLVTRSPERKPPRPCAGSGSPPPAAPPPAAAAAPPARPPRRPPPSRARPSEARRALAQDQVPLLQPRHLPPQPLRFRFLGLVLGQ